MPIPNTRTVRTSRQHGDTLVVINDIAAVAKVLLKANFNRVVAKVLDQGYYISKGTFMVDKENVGAGARGKLHAWVASIAAIPLLLTLANADKDIRKQWAQAARKIDSLSEEQLRVTVERGASARPARRPLATQTRRAAGGTTVDKQAGWGTVKPQTLTEVEAQLRRDGVIDDDTSPGRARKVARKWEKHGRERELKGSEKMLTQFADKTTNDAEAQLALHAITGRSSNDRKRANHVLTRLPAVYSGQSERRTSPAKKLVIMADDGTVIGTAAMPDLIRDPKEAELHELLYGELKCEDEIDCGLSASHAQAALDGSDQPDEDGVISLSAKALQLRTTTTITADDVDLNTIIPAVDYKMIICKEKTDHLYNPLTFCEPRRGRPKPLELCKPREQTETYNITDSGLQHGLHGRNYVGVERWFSVNGAAVCARVWALQTWIAVLLMSLRPFFWSSTAPIYLTLEVSAWMDGTSMLKHATGASTWSFRLLDNTKELGGKLLASASDRANASTMKLSETLSKGFDSRKGWTKPFRAVQKLLDQPVPCFFGFLKETREFGQVVARLMGAQLRYSTRGYYLRYDMPGGQTVRVLLKGGKLRGDYHAIQSFLGLFMSGKRVCPFLQVDEGYGDYTAWMLALKANGGVGLTLTNFLQIARRETGATDEELETFSEQVRNAKVFGPAPIFAGDYDAENLEHRGLDPGPIVADPEHVLSALIKNTFYELEEHLSKEAQTKLGTLVARYVRDNTSYKDHMDGRDWRNLLLQYDKIVLPAVQMAKGPVAEATLLLKCLLIMYVCITKEPADIDKQAELLFRAASFAWGCLLEHLQSIGYFSGRVFNLYYIYMRVFLPELYCAANAPKLASTQANEAMWGPIRAMLLRGDRKFDRSMLLDVARHMAGRGKYISPYGTAEDMRTHDASSLISKAEKRAKDAGVPVFWKTQDFVIPSWLLRLPSVGQKAALFEELILKSDYTNMHKKNSDGSWSFWTATAPGQPLRPMEMPAAGSVKCSTERTMRLVIQPPPPGASSTVKGCADKVMIEESSGSIEQVGGAEATMRPTARHKTTRLTKAECRAICQFYRTKRGEDQKGLTKSTALRGDGGLQQELWRHCTEFGDLTVEELEEALGELVPSGYVLAAASSDDARRARQEAEDDAEREEEEAEVAAIAQQLEREAAEEDAAAPMDEDSA